MKRELSWLLLLLLAPTMSLAETMQLIVSGTNAQGNEWTGKGTCFVVGKVDNGRLLFVTAKHNLKGAEEASVIKRGVGYQVFDIREHATEDVASFEAEVPYGGQYEFRMAVDRIRVEVLGFGPHYHGRQSCGFTGEVVATGMMVGDGGLHSCVGDSGGPVVWKDDYVVGLVSGVADIQGSPQHRSEYARQQPKTVIVDSVVIHKHLTQYYSRQCGPDGCSVYLRPQIQQRQFLGIPVGRPEIVGVTPPIDSIGFVTRPGAQQQAPQYSKPAPAPSSSGSAVVSQQDVRKALEDLIRERPELFRGPAGPQGPPGEQKPIRVIWSDGKKKIDEEVYQPGAALVFDRSKLQSSGGGR